MSFPKISKPTRSKQSGKGRHGAGLHAQSLSSSKKSSSKSSSALRSEKARGVSQRADYLSKRLPYTMRLSADIPMSHRRAATVYAEASGAHADAYDAMKRVGQSVKAHHHLNKYKRLQKISLEHAKRQHLLRGRRTRHTREH